MKSGVNISAGEFARKVQLAEPLVEWVARALKPSGLAFWDGPNGWRIHVDAVEFIVNPEGKPLPLLATGEFCPTCGRPFANQAVVPGK